MHSWTGLLKDSPIKNLDDAKHMLSAAEAKAASFGIYGPFPTDSAFGGIGKGVALL